MHRAPSACSAPYPAIACMPQAGGEVGSGDDKIAYRLITKNGASGFLKFTLPKAHGGKPLPDGHYLFTLQADYGRKARVRSC